MSAGMVYFVGAGPGAPDLITVRGRTIIEQADLVLYADSLVQASVAGLAQKPGARIVGSADLHLGQIVDLMTEVALSGGVVARVHTGDPALYGAIHEQMRLLRERNVAYAVVPGVSAAFAAAARLGVELTIPEVTQTLILSRSAGRTPVPPREGLGGLAAHGASLVLYLSVDQIEQVVEGLLASGGYTPTTPAAVVYRVSWPDEQVVRGTLADIAEAVRQAGFTRHALIMVGAALDPALTSPASRLYDPNFSHGYRRGVAEVSGTFAVGLKPPARYYKARLRGLTPARVGGLREVSPRLQSLGATPPLIIAVSRRGSQLAHELAQGLGGEAWVPRRFALGDTQHYEGPVAALIAQQWQPGRTLVLVMAAGIAVRACAPLLGHKSSDPAVICLDEAGNSVIPLLGGHRAGANALARQIAHLTGGHAAITTASDTQGLPALDLLGQEQGWRVDPASALTHTMGCLVNGEALGCYVHPALHAQRQLLETWLAACPDLTFVDDPAQLLDARYRAGVLVSHMAHADLWPQLASKGVRYNLPLLVVGMGCRRGVPRAELEAALLSGLDAAGLSRANLAALATVEQKAQEAGLIALAEGLGLRLEIVTAAQMAHLNPSDFSPSAASEHLDLIGVAEPAALLVAGGELLVPKQRFERCTLAVALCQPRPSGHLTLVSLGPGDPQQMTLAAHAALREAEVVVGYQGYIESIQGLLTPQQTVIASGMKTEVERAMQAIEAAEAGRRVALVSSGDIGIYAMAGPVFEGLQARGWDGQTPQVRVLPGISAFQAAAARMGAAISHDFCVISLSDLLTPWDLIERRLAAAANGDLVVALYNPRSQDRHWQLGVALDILRTQRNANTPVIFATNVARPDERMVVTTLSEADPTLADMFTVVLIGNSRSYIAGGHVVTPRGYAAGGRMDVGPHPPSPPLPFAARTGEGGIPHDVPVAQDPSVGAHHNAPVAQDPPVGAHRDAPTRVPEYPIVLTGMQGVAVTVVGGGAVGERKVRGLLAAGAAVRLISPLASAQLQAWAAAGQIEWEARPFQAGDLEAARLAFACTNQRAVNAMVAHEAAERGVLCNVADAPSEGNFHLPALHRSAGLTVAVSTSGSSPARAAALRDAIARWLMADNQ
ncbi:precorrin-4 C(11)-methyltransferase [Candidatus Oscillochloris fontis]|uniref:precorrin-4 C(11)-methyltransferase n=1 Tax=Candidatus Oscillochloris fontis TaxID=2496868 RepID=UPI00101BBB09|nr:precorrin-4 C(11)-methyltransferase [Candidatus Oscillochloris fontis]